MRLISFTLVPVALVVAGCGAPIVVAASSRDAVAIPGDVSAALAWDDGVVFVRDGIVQRMQGVGNELTPLGVPVAVEQLLDVDDHGALYVFPAEATAPGVLSTMLDGEYPGSMVARVSPNDDVTKMTAAGRGIWAFGVASSGDALWQDACGPTGIFDVTQAGVTASTLMRPSTPWGILTDAQTFWSVDAQSNALVRTTRDGSVEVGVDVEEGAIVRCGARVCGVSADAVVEWDHEGAVVRTITRDDAGAAADEAFASVTANQHGVYVTLSNAERTRVVFVP